MKNDKYNYYYYCYRCDLMKSTCPGLDNFVRPKPEYITCPNCGNEVEIWTDEEETTCESCGATVSRKVLSCLEWCEYADKCKEIIAEIKGSR